MRDREPDWEGIAAEFVADWRARRPVVGALVCGSYVTGQPTPRSDVDVVLVLAEGTRWRERGNRIVDGLMIEYFANTPGRYQRYFREDHARHRAVTATMFCTGRVLFDDTGEVARLVRQARRARARPLPRLAGAALQTQLYGLWDVLDNTRDAFEGAAPDRQFQYHHAVAAVYECYARYQRQPVLQVDRIFKIYGPGGRPRKYLLDAFPDPAFARLLVAAVRETDVRRMPGRLERLAAHAFDHMGGFEIDGWRLRTPAG